MRFGAGSWEASLLEQMGRSLFPAKSNSPLKSGVANLRAP